MLSPGPRMLVSRPKTSLSWPVTTTMNSSPSWDDRVWSSSGSGSISMKKGSMCRSVLPRPREW